MGTSEKNAGNPPGKAVEGIAAGLPGRDCGLCGFKTCRELAGLVLHDPEALKRCVFLEQAAGPPPAVRPGEKPTWKDLLDRPYEFVLEKFPDDPGPREVILPFNPANTEKLGVKVGSVLFGRPASVGCPVTHAGVVVEEPDYLNGLVVWCVIGPVAARSRGVEIGCYTPVAYEGVVRHSRKKLQVGRRYYFLPGYCMLQSRHSGVVSFLARTATGFRVRIEGILIA